jgi:branched-chain amino acid transport system permease protein
VSRAAPGGRFIAAARNRRAVSWAALGVTTIAAFAAAPLLGAGSLNLGVTLLGYLAIAQAWNVLAGYSGQVSLGSAAFVATGGYTAALVLAHTGLSWPEAIAAAGLTSALLAILVAVPLLRLRGDYFAVGTLAISVVIQALLANWPWAGGAAGFTPPVGAIPSGGNLFQLAVLVAALAMGLAVFVSGSDFGLRLAAIRDSEAAAAGLGVAAWRHRVTAFIASSTIIGMAGAVVAFQFIAVSPDEIASLSWSLNAVLMAIVGGTGTVLGPVAGVLIVYYGLTQELANFPTVSQLLEGLLFVVIVRAAPSGIWPLAGRLGRRLASRAAPPDGRASEPEAVTEPATASISPADLV